MKQTDARQNGMRILIVVLLLLAAGLFVTRGVMRAAEDSGDFYLIYAASRTWLTGGNPYDERDQLESVMSANAPGEAPDRPLISLYPPTTAVVIAPLSIGSWVWAKYAWLSVNLVTFSLLFIGVVRLSEMRLTRMRAWWLLVVLLAFAPIHTGLRTGQLGIASACGVVWGFVLLRQDRAMWAGVLLGLAAALKPQIAGLFLAAPLTRGQWKAFGTACGVGALIALIAIVPMELRGIAWLDSLAANVRAFGRGGIGDPGPANQLRHQLINLAYPLTAALGQTPAVRIGVVLVCAALVLAAGVGARRGRGVDDDLLVLGLLGLVSLMAVYHRAYDAALLAIPLAWALRHVRAGAPWTVWATLVLCLVFLLPGPSMLFEMARRGVIPPAVSQAGWWRVLALPHEGWALLLLAATLTWAMLSGQRPSTAR